MEMQKEIQVIPIQRKPVHVIEMPLRYHEPVRQQQKDVPSRKRKKQKHRKRYGIWMIKLCMILLAVLCLVTNWFTEIPMMSKSAKLEKIKEQGDCPAELLELAEKNEETYEFVRDYPNREKYQKKEIDLSRECRSKTVPLLMQWDKRWGYEMYGDSMLALSGCGPTCMTMAYLYHTKDATMHPAKMAEYAQKEGYHTKEGTSWEFWTKGAEALGLYGEEISLDEKIMEAVLDAGGVIVCSMSPGDFTDGGHYILIRGYDEKGFFVNDPNRKSNSKKQWDFATLCGQIKNLWAIYGE